jgi:hypothetical protein
LLPGNFFDTSVEKYSIAFTGKRSLAMLAKRPSGHQCLHGVGSLMKVEGLNPAVMVFVVVTSYGQQHTS